MMNLFKKVFAIKRILAVVIKETIGLYRTCTLDEIVGLVESVGPGQDYCNDKITIS